VTDADGIGNGADLIAVPLLGMDVVGRDFLDDGLEAGSTLSSIGGFVYDDGGFGVPGADNTFSADDVPVPGVVVLLYATWTMTDGGCERTGRDGPHRRQRRVQLREPAT